ncbi:MAG: polyphosphate kinase 2 family protein [Bacteroidales bacterium]|nr:polyphosphate kinase 2 family protein [Bacteroidales bacterium]
MAIKKETIPVKAPENSRITAITELSRKEFISRAKKFSKQYRVTSDKKFKLKDFPTWASEYPAKAGNQLSQQSLQLGIQVIAEMQDKMYAADKWSLLIIFQAMDAAGKDSAIKHVMSGINPQGCEVTSFKAPSAEELDHDFLWRCIKKIPERGHIGIFNRSYYEEVLVVRVHEEILKAQKLPDKLITESIWDDRLTDIHNYESYLNRNGILVVKIFLNVSKKEQKKRFLERIDKPEKNWKFSAGDLVERKYWKQYMAAYEDMIKKTASDKSPWYVVPADDKPYARLVIASAIITAMDSMKLAYPKISDEQMAELQRLKEELMAEKG